jgi:hypothetical protein
MSAEMIHVSGPEFQDVPVSSKDWDKALRKSGKAEQKPGDEGEAI